MSRPTYHCPPFQWVREIPQQTTWVQLWLSWGVTWSILGPLLCLALWMDWWRV